METSVVAFIASFGSICERFWDGSRDTWMLFWETMKMNYSNRMLYIGGTFILVSIMFWGYSLALAFLDVFQRPKFLLKYKIQEEKNMPVDRKKLLGTIKHVARMFFTLFPALLYISYPLAEWRGGMFDSELPSFQMAIFHFFAFLVVEEIMFYYSHRLAHTKLLYKYIHKRHHEWQASVGVVALYAHPLEFLISNLIPVGIGPIIMGSHVLLMWVWISISIATTVNTHSGYHFPGMLSPECHDYHHLKFNCCYGVMGVLDYLHNTDKTFYEAQESTRHRTFYSTVPIKAQDTGKPTRPKSILKLLF